MGPHYLPANTTMITRIIANEGTILACMDANASFSLSLSPRSIPLPQMSLLLSHPIPSHPGNFIFRRNIVCVPPSTEINLWSERRI